MMMPHPLKMSEKLLEVGGKICSWPELVEDWTEFRNNTAFCNSTIARKHGGARAKRKREFMLEIIKKTDDERNTNMKGEMETRWQKKLNLENWKKYMKTGARETNTKWGEEETQKEKDYER